MSGDKINDRTRLHDEILSLKLRIVSLETSKDLLNLQRQALLDEQLQNSSGSSSETKALRLETEEKLRQVHEENKSLVRSRLTLIDQLRASYLADGESAAPLDWKKICQQNKILEEPADEWPLPRPREAPEPRTTEPANDEQSRNHVHDRSATSQAQKELDLSPRIFESPREAPATPGSRQTSFAKQCTTKPKCSCPFNVSKCNDHCQESTDRTSHEEATFQGNTAVRLEMEKNSVLTKNSDRLSIARKSLNKALPQPIPDYGQVEDIDSTSANKSRSSDVSSLLSCSHMVDQCHEPALPRNSPTTITSSINHDTSTTLSNRDTFSSSSSFVKSERDFIFRYDDELEKLKVDEDLPTLGPALNSATNVTRRELENGLITTIPPSREMGRTSVSQVPNFSRKRSVAMES